MLFYAKNFRFGVPEQLWNNPPKYRVMTAYICICGTKEIKQKEQYSGQRDSSMFECLLLFLSSLPSTHYNSSRMPSNPADILFWFPQYCCTHAHTEHSLINKNKSLKITYSCSCYLFTLSFHPYPIQPFHLLPLFPLLHPYHPCSILLSL